MDFVRFTPLLGSIARHYLCLTMRTQTRAISVRGTPRRSAEMAGTCSTREAFSKSPVNPSECAGEHQRHDQDARSEDEHVLRLAQVEVADATDELMANGKVEEAPQDIDHRGGQAFS
jgi:hypothetical protein